MSSNAPASSLIGRRAECGTLDRLVATIRAGQSRVLVLRGEAGVGKTALLDYLAGRAPGCQVAWANGVESELEIPYSALQQLCAPMLHRLDVLPEPQRDALSTAFGLSVGTPPDPFLVGLASLGLLAAHAADQSLICVIDDVQWLDRISAQTLAFVARRLMAERVAMVFAVRDEGSDELLARFDTLEVQGLRSPDARALLESAIPGRLDVHIRDRIVAETRGNPLALLELPRGRTPAELAGGFERPDTRPLASRIEQSFVRRLESLPGDTQRLLLTAAADPVGDSALLKRALAHLGISPDAATPAEAAGLIEFGARVRFRHPLVRSAAYRAASVTDRRDVHRALAQATCSDVDPDRRAWHAAHAAAFPDETVAGQLERSAGRARARGGVAAEAALLQRATELTPDGARRSARALAAAAAKIEAAAPDEADELLVTAELGPLSDLERARIARLRAQIVFARNHGTEAAPLLFTVAAQLEGLDAAAARDTYLETLGATIFAGRLGDPQVQREAAKAALGAPLRPGPPRSTDLLLDGVAARLTEGYVSAAPMLRSALAAFRSDGGASDAEITRWLWLAWLVAADLWDFEASHELASRAMRTARETGALTVLPVALVYRAGVHFFAGDLNLAAAMCAEADSITATTGFAPVRTTQTVLAAVRGDDVETTRLIEAVVQDATARGEGRALGSAAYGTAILNNGLGRYDEALIGAQKACEHDDLGFYSWSLAELIEAAVRTGELDAAAAALHKLEARTLAAGTDWALGFLARGRALLSDDDGAEAFYLEAIERLERTPIVVHTGRAHLLYGEWLRGQNRSADALVPLRTAEAMLSRIGADAFAERARREMAASGERVRRPIAPTQSVLSPQEYRIARLAADGMTNQEIGTRLFISAHTVEWHLRKVFTKFDVRSRKQLTGKLSGATSVR
ncbi:helix-turn-helix transcriptional regulator [Mycolicibacterium sp. P9-64]|uniref:helix-turn-helix transcriptional regulator n=1 Tax=Mycolicibacterium sp. P9-64 TaxID=2024612 RepID=UPI0011ECBE73|nr:AAA family ATPase [Mycolicibacterium sp. P9-64]KAA0079073.1 helix-turn-helix transcriptional regulator [Mycolicibacterium sp. P9-64]